MAGKVADSNSSILGLFNQLNQQETQAAAVGETFEMVVIRGADVSVDQFQSGSLLPNTITPGAAGNSNSNALSDDPSNSDSDGNSDNSDPDSRSDDSGAEGVKIDE